MKLLIVTSLKEHRTIVSLILEQAKIAVYSASDILGFKNNDLPSPIEGWFAGGSGEYNSIFLFSFTEESNADVALNLIKKYNKTEDCKFPIRGFVVPVEKSSY